MSFSYKTFMSLTHFPGLDGLRAFACLVVVEQHLADELIPHIDGRGGVYIFFVLSGFLITTLLLREEEKYKTISVKAFYIRRTFRIFPVYYFVLALYCALYLIVPLMLSEPNYTLVINGGQMKTALPYYIFYFPEYIPDNMTAGFGQAWSLGIEEKFYLVWPVMGFIAIGYAKREWRLKLTLILAIILLGVYGLLISLDIKQGFQGYYMLAIGCLLALLLNEEKSYARFQALVNNAFGPAIIILLFAAVYVYRVQFEPFIIAIYPLAVAALIGLAVIGNGKVTAFLEIRAFRFIGLISYGIYLIHILAINAVQMVIEPGSGSLAITTLIFLCSVGLSIFAAWLMYLTIEKPCIHYGRKLSRAVKRPAPSELASENG